MDELSEARLATVQRIKDKAKADRAEKASDTPEPVADNKRSTRGPQIIVAVAICGAVLWAAQAIVVPTVMAVVLALVLTPVVAMLEKWRIPTGAAALIVVLMAAAAIGGGALALAPGVTDWMKRAPEISRSIERKVQPVKEWLASFQAASNQLDKITDVGAAPGAATVVAAPASSQTLLETAPAALAQTVYVIVLALFLIGSRKTYRKRLIMLSSDRDNRLRVARIMNESLEQVSGYLFTMMCVSIGLAVITAVCFAIAGIENAIVWGAAFGAASIIPYIGPTAVILLCGLVQFATQDTIGAAAVAPLLLLAINTIESNFVTPFLVSRRIEISALAIFLSLAVFIWLWGAMASILAVPLLILFHAIAKHVPSLQPYAVLLQSENDHAEEAPASPLQRFFRKTSGTEAADWRAYLGHFFPGLRKTAVLPAISEATPDEPAPA